MNTLKILFVCTHNRCRSILSEAITNQTSDGLIVARSAGSSPSGVVHPLTLQYLQKNNLSIEGLHSDSYDTHRGFQPDIVLTVCDSANNEPCPVWLGDAIKAHWGLADPSKLAESDNGTDDVENAFNEVIETIKYRIDLLKTIAYKYQEKPLSETQLKKELSKLSIIIG